MEKYYNTGWNVDNQGLMMIHKGLMDNDLSALTASVVPVVCVTVKRTHL